MFSIVQLNIDMSIDTDSVAKVIIFYKNTILMLHKHDASGWELPGGHLNLGENFKQGAFREVFEETNIKLRKLKPILQQPKFTLFVSRAKNVDVRLSSEHREFRWVNVKQLLKLKLTKSTKINLKTILQTVSDI